MTNAGPKTAEDPFLDPDVGGARASVSPSSFGHIDSHRLEGLLKVVAYANRLDLLEILRRPHTLQDIRLMPGPSNAGERPERPISRQAVAHHLEQLVAAGLVRASVTKRPGKKPLNEFTVDQAQLYALVEEFRRVSTLGAQPAANLAETVAMGAGAQSVWEPGPKLVLVHGVYEGKAYLLRSADLSKGRGWVIGRRHSCTVNLSYDPFVSLENSEIMRTKEGFKIVDLRSSRNGTYLNWQRLPVGGEAALEPGDIVGVGRSSLAFKAH